MSDTTTNTVEDTAMHLDSLVAKQIEKTVVKAIRILINENMNGLSFMAYAIDGVFKVNIERMPS